MLNLRRPDRITSIIPTARKFEYGGTTLVAVPHRLDEVRVLRNMGIEAPSPFKYYYDFPGLQSPFAHQVETGAFLTTNPKAFCLNGMGTGKTLAVLWAANYLMCQGEIDAVVVLAPLSTLEDTWNSEAFKNFGEMTTAVVHGTVDRRHKMIRSDVDLYIINHHGILNASTLDELLALCKRRRILLIVDEVAVFRNSSTKLWKALKKLVDATPWTWALTGTPIPNAPTDAWAQCRLINPASVPKYFGAFRDRVMRQAGPFKWIARENALDTVYEVMQPAIRFSREACIDLPPTIHQTRHVPLSPEQHKLYNEMLAKFKAEYAGGQISAINEAAKLSKLLQICCGVAYGASDDIIIPAPERVDLVREIIEQADAKVIVFVPFTGALNALAEELSKTFSVGVIHGGVPANKRGDIFASFRSASGYDVLVADARTMAHGLNLTVANTIVWFGPAPSNEVYQQANARVPRPGQKLSTFIIHIEGSPAERKRYDQLTGKSRTQSILLDMFEDK